MAAAASAALLSGCSGIPNEGPSADAVAQSATGPNGTVNYVLLPLDAKAANEVRAYYDTQVREPSWKSLPPPAPAGTVGPGDDLHISLWDAGSFTAVASLDPTGAASASAPGRGMDLTVGVDGAGTIALPYAGRWKVAGETPPEIEQDVVRRLKGKFAAPQASVLVTQEIWNTVFVQGAVKKPGRVSLPPTGLRLLDALALAGGLEFPEAEDVVELTRGEATMTVPLLAVLGGGHDANVRLSPGDVVLMLRRPQYFFAFGAVNRPGEQIFDQREDRLMDLMGHIGGIADWRANASGFFVFRHEPAALVRKLEPKPVGDGAPTADGQAVVYRVDMNRPDSFFVMNTFPIRPGDVVYVANAPLTDFNKIMQAITGVTGMVGNVGFTASTAAGL